MDICHRVPGFKIYLHSSLRIYGFVQNAWGLASRF